MKNLMNYYHHDQWLGKVLFYQIPQYSLHKLIFIMSKSPMLWLWNPNYIDWILIWSIFSSMVTLKICQINFLSPLLPINSNFPVQNQCKKLDPVRELSNKHRSGYPISIQIFYSYTREIQTWTVAAAIFSRHHDHAIT